jgi:hypothetical protein
MNSLNSEFLQGTPMSDPHAFGFGPFVPGFDFLKNLTQSAAQAQPATGAMPGMASWVAPTLSVEEIDKRIQELKAVQFWLDQNATALKASIQAMEVQKMTLSTLQSMNVSMADLAKAFTAKPPSNHSPTRDAAAPEAASAPKTSLFTPKPAPQPASDLAAHAAPQAAQTSAKEATSNGPPEQEPAANTAAQSAVDPMQWWNALTQQFQAIASTALKDVAAEAMKPDVAKPERKASGKAKKAPAQEVKPAPVKSPASKSVKSNATAKSAASAISSKKAPRKVAPARSVTT